MPERDEHREQQARIRLGERIRDLRKAKGISQDVFADLVGLHRTHPNKIEHGKIDVRFSTLLRISDALDVELRDLMDIPKD